MLRTLLIDDEAHIRDTLTILLKRHCPDVQVIGEASGVVEGIEAINDLNPDLVILDIHLGDGTGFDLLRSLGNINFKLIFISAFNGKMIQAFRLSSLEYLLKPVNPVDLIAAVRSASVLDQRELVMQMKALDANMKAFIE